LLGEWDGQENWYGGRIQQVARLSKLRAWPVNGCAYTICLEAMEKRRSHRFARFCGSRRILQIRIPAKYIFEEATQLKEFFRQRFVLCGRIFVPFYAKDHSLYLVETNEDWERQSREAFGDQHRKSFTEFVNWHNPPECNQKQVRYLLCLRSTHLSSFKPLTKYVNRFALGLSTTIPVLEFQEKNIFLIDDICELSLFCLSLEGCK